MYLKSIELRGFKSFADKTELTFKKGVTTIVGPNGSGKSNISDGIRWVLGEQSVKSLRGGKMEDVIFAGTQFRKSVGLAQVSLTLDNQDKELPLDYSSISISRRLYRSGESEYYINNTHCRLKDIQELFMDTGIGKEGYSIIGQGKIDAVLSGKPEERRSLLEEAAGIVKYKTRKEEAEKKLQFTEQNVIRLNDILSTYEERLEPLRTESEKAKEFIKFSEELKQKEINIIIHLLDNIQKTITSNKDKLFIIEKEVNEINQEKDHSKELLNNFNKELEIFESKNVKAKQEYYSLNENYHKYENEIKIFNERIDNLSKIIEKTKVELNCSEEKLKLLTNSKSEHTLSLNNLKNTQQELNSKIRNMSEELTSISSFIEKSENTIKDLKDDQIEILSNKSNINNLIVVFNNKFDNLNSRLLQLKNSSEAYEKSLQTNKLTKMMLEEQLSETQKNIMTLENKVTENKSQISKLNHSILHSESELKSLNVEHNKLEANHTMLLNLDKQYEGYNRSVKILMQDINKSKINIPKGSECFVLGEVINVEKRFEIAIEVTLGSSISNIITSDEDIAKHLINYLKINNLGRATFLPLTTVRGKKVIVSNELKKMKGYIGIASELIEYNSKFSNAIEFILGRTIVCEDMDSALSIAKKNNYSFRIVTLTGEMVNPGGSLTGGSIHHKITNIIGRKREIQEIQSRINEICSSIDKITKHINNMRHNVKKLDDEVLNYKDEVYSSNIEITKIKERISSLDNEDKRLQQNISTANDEIVSIENEIVLNTENIKNNSLELEHINKKLQQNTKNINELENNLKLNNTNSIGIREKLTSLKVEKAKIDETTFNKINELNRLASEIADIHSRIKSLNDEHDNSLLEKEKCIKSIEYNKSSIENLKKQLNAMEEGFKNYEIEKTKIKDKIAKAESMVENISSQIFLRESEKHKLELNLARLETECEAHYCKLNEEFNITYAEGMKYKSNIENMEAYKNSINMLKNSISSLGVVNVGAIEEYKDLKEKYFFMVSQKEDLINAKDELISVIKDMTEKIKIVFRENFNKLREYFNDTFKELFKGGSADLVLCDGDELDGNIDITVQPPGKKLQNINLMSGGEKGLSAIALLFAILKMKPTPFCILDEIEAALDDANVARYAEFLKMFSDNIQFIVITHRKGTMEASDALYGVTMEEKGVSKIVSVDLSKMEE